MNLSERIAALSAWGEELERIDHDYHQTEGSTTWQEWNQLLQTAFHKNGWFTEDQIWFSLRRVREMLQQEALENWVKEYTFPAAANPKSVAVIMAGNIPLVGFHDLLCVLISGNRAMIKLSSDDAVLFPRLIQLLFKVEPRMESFLQLVPQRMEGMDAVIATGSNNTARYFESYFGKYPNIIRKNRTSVAVLTGDESDAELQGLAEDIFRYYGLGCRNVSKVWIPEGYDVDRLFKSFLPHAEIMQHKKYMNNYLYHRTLFLMNKEALLDNEFILLKEDSGLHSPLGVLYYQYYADLKEVDTNWTQLNAQIQCSIGRGGIPFGKGQYPALNDYADHVDTLKFLLNIA